MKKVYIRTAIYSVYAKEYEACEIRRLRFDIECIREQADHTWDFPIKKEQHVLRCSLLVTCMNHTVFYFISLRKFLHSNGNRLIAIFFGAFYYGISLSRIILSFFL